MKLVTDKSTFKSGGLREKHNMKYWRWC
jgi:hypothetical protein